MSEIVNEILDELEVDFCYHAEVDAFLRERKWRQLEKAALPGIDLNAITPLSPIIRPTEEELRNALRELLESGKIEIGETSLETPDYLSFIGWRGTVDQKLDRAIKEVLESNETDRPFVYWLSLRDRVDRYENPTD